MEIRYFWENMEVNVGDYPHSHTEIRDVEYYFDVQVKTRDIVDYLMPYNLGKQNKKKTQEEVNECGLANYYMTKAIDYLLDNLSIDLDELEQDEYFVEFMHDRYEDRALDNWEEENELERY